VTRDLESLHRELSVTENPKPEVPKSRNLRRWKNRFEILKHRKDLRRRSKRGLTIGFHLEWTWTHGCVPRASGSKRKVKVVGPYDVTGSDVDLLKDTMCHCLGRRQLCCGPRGREVKISEVRSWRGK
jgi:hypothetical protein